MHVQDLLKNARAIHAVPIHAAPTSRSSQRNRPWLPALVIGALVSAVSAACSSSPPGTDNSSDANGSGSTGSGTDSGSGSTGSGTDSGSGGAGSGTDSGSTSGGSGNTVNDPNDACGLSTTGNGSGHLGGSSGAVVPGFESCSGVSFESEASESDIFFLVDRSVSMGEHRVSDAAGAPTRWEALTVALKQFFADPASDRLRVGLGFFPKFGDESCDVDAYATPDVEIDFLSENADALIAAIDENTSEDADGDLFPRYGGLTPSVPAYQGALTYAKQWAEDHPERPTVVVFATDGYPTDPTAAEDACDDTSISTLEDLAEEYVSGEPRISTFVVGIGEVSNLKRVADAGGTKNAFFVNDCPTAVEDLAISLKRVANSPALCGFDLPEPPAGQTLDIDEVNMVFTPRNGAPELIYKVPTTGNCGTKGGWFYDNANEPTKILVCPQTCSLFGGGTIEIVVGCESQILG